MDKSRKVSDKEFDKLTFGKETINLQIPRFTNILIVTTISEATNGTKNVQTITYDTEEIKNFIEGEKK